VTDLGGLPMPEQQPERMAQDAMNQISDIIVNHHEAGYKYTQNELRRILHSIVEVVELFEGSKAGIGPIHGTRRTPEADLEIQLRHSQPVVSATIHSDDHHSVAAFQANRWLSDASDDQIKELFAISWGGDLEADEVAYFMEPLDLSVELALDYSRTGKQLSGDPMGFEVHVDGTEALAWLSAHRPELFKELSDA
jgi:hypothetical protein